MRTTPDGPFWVQYESNLGWSGVGELFVRNGVFWGCDEGYRYKGYLERVGGCYFGKAVITQVDRNAVSIFGPVERFEIEVSGRNEKGRLLFSGRVLGAEHLRLRFVLSRRAMFAAE
jgi:T3SS negative regulator,GrlR